MTLRTLAAAACFSLVAATAGFATTVTIGFETFPAGNPAGDILPGTTFSEGGFDFTGVSGQEFGIRPNAGNPGNELSVGPGGTPNPGDTLSITRSGGGLFEFLSLDLASFSGTAGRSIDIVGLLNGVAINQALSVSSATSAFQTIFPLFGQFDELQLIATGNGSSTLLLDNFSFNEIAPVPLPAGGLLLLSGLAGVGLLKRRKKRAA